MRKDAKLTPIDNIMVTYNQNENIKTLLKITEYEMYLDKLIHQKIHLYDSEMDMKPFYTSLRDVANNKVTLNFHR